MGLRLGGVLLCLVSLAARGDDFVARVFTDAGGKTMPYRLLVPPDVGAKSYPVVIFFHGSGERGADNALELKHGVMAFALPAVRAKYPAIIIAPQCPVRQKWVDMEGKSPTSTRTAEPTEGMQLALKILDSVTAEFNGDRSRLYVTGLSMGGFATWDCVTRYPERFAAAVAVCGGGDETTVNAAVAKVPIWALASSDDPTVPPLRSVHMIEAVIKAGGHPRLTLYVGLGHNSWDRAYSEPDLIGWMFSHRLDSTRRAPIPTPAPAAVSPAAPPASPATVPLSPVL